MCRLAAAVSVCRRLGPTRQRRNESAPQGATDGPRRCPRRRQTDTATVSRCPMSGGLYASDPPEIADPVPTQDRSHSHPASKQLQPEAIPLQALTDRPTPSVDRTRTSSRTHSERRSRARQGGADRGRRARRPHSSRRRTWSKRSSIARERASIARGPRLRALRVKATRTFGFNKKWRHEIPE